MNIKENDLFKSVFKATVEGILVADNQGNIIMTNMACEEMFGYNTGELTGENIDILVPDKFKNKHQIHLKNYSINPTNRTFGKELNLLGIKKDGSNLYLDISLSPTIINDITVIIAFLKDITKHKKNIAKIKQANKALIESNRKYHALINNQEGIVYRCKNSRDWEIDFISDGCLSITGYHHTAFKDHTVNFGQIIVPEDKEHAWETVQGAIKFKKPYSLEYRIKHKDGSLKYVWEKGQAVFNEKGQVLALEGFISDITLQKKTEFQLKASEAKNKALLNAIPDMMFIQNFEGDFLDFYASNKKKLIVDPEQIIGKNMKDILPPDVFKKMDAALKTTIQDNQIQIIEYAIKGKDDKEYFEARTVLLNDHKVLTIVRDITENKKLEQEVKAAGIRSDAILNALPDLFFVQDKNATVLEVYASNPSLLIAPKEALLGKNIKEIFPTELASKISEKLSNVRKSREMEFLQMKIESMRGLMDFDVRFVPLANNKTLSIARDITEEKAKGQLLNIRNRALAAAGNGIIIVDAQVPNLPVIYCNDSFEKITGYNKNEVYGRNCRFLQRDDRDQKEIAIIRSALKKGIPCKVTLRNYRKDATLFWNELTITPLHNSKGKLTHFIGVQNDVTHKKKEEYFKDQILKILEGITKNEPIKTIGNTIIETIEAHCDNCIASILLLDKNNNTLHKLVAAHLPKAFNDFIEGMTIGSKNNSNGISAFAKKEVVVADIETDILWDNHRETALKNGLKSCWSYPIKSSNNKLLGIFALYSKSPRKPLENEKEIILEMTYLASVAIEQNNNTIAIKESKKQLEKYTQKLEEKVQERTQEVMSTVQKLVETNLDLEVQIEITKKAEKEALVGKALTTAIAQNFPKGIITVVNHDFEILFAEGEALVEFGLKETIAEGMTIDDILTFSENQKSKIKENILKTLIGEHLYFEVNNNNNNNNNNNYYSVNTVPLYNEDKTATTALIVYNNISQQKKIEIDMQLALKKEQELNELKSRFISMASHEFRTPLSVILTSAILIDKQNAIGSYLENKKYLNKITNSVNNLELILNDFLSLSKLDEGKIIATQNYFDLIQFSKSLTEEIEVNLKNGQTISITHRDIKIPVNLDSKLLRHILLNLLSNATKYSPENADINLKIINNHEKVYLKIIDQGIGIPEEEQKNLFQRFFRAKNAVNIEGTGIGLNIVKHYLGLMQGTINFESKLNNGSTFTIELPKNNVTR
jgi:PAS domain S-box-containing protein